MVLYAELTDGKRRSGGQKKRYKNQLHILLQRAGIANRWEQLAEERTTWRKMIHEYQGSDALKPRRKAQDPVTFICNDCQRLITSRIGMIAHSRTHNK